MRFSLVFFVLLFASTGHAGESERSMREVCRQWVSGQYIRIFDRWATSVDYLAQLKSKTKALEAAHAESSAKLAALKAKGYSEDVKEQEAIIAAQQTEEQLRTNVQEHKDLVANAEQVNSAAQATKKSVDAKIRNLFNIETAGKGDRPDYPMRLTFRQECPKYRLNCPLERANARDLKDLANQLGVSEDCEKYAAQH